MAEKRQRPSNFRLEIPGNESFKKEVQDKLQKVKSAISRVRGKPVNNADVITEMLDFWMNQNITSDGSSTFPSPFQQVKGNEVNQKLFVTAESSLKNYGSICAAHAKLCNGNLRLCNSTMRGHVLSTRLKCTRDAHHSYLWSSSPYLPNDEYLVNHRINHGLMCSGLLPIHYTRFVNGAGIGSINKEKRKLFTKTYLPSIKEEYDESLEDALLYETGQYEHLSGINIMTDARHGWRKNAKDTSVVAIGDKGHKVLVCEHVTKSEDPVSQRHEKLGTNNIYKYFDEQNVSINVHTHDRNLSINKLVRETGFTGNQNDIWHAVKSLKKNLTNISKGPKAMEGKTWSEEIYDKVEPVATHFHWAIKNCDQDPRKLRQHLDNITEHYKNNHANCYTESRCRKDKNYEPSRLVITNPKAEKLLETVIKTSVIYKYPEDYILGKDTFYVESFNNVMNIFQNKRIAFGTEQYKMRSDLATCHWNENVDRAYTSIHKSSNPNAPRNQKGKKNYKAPTYNYRTSIWQRYINSIFTQRG